MIVVVPIDGKIVNHRQVMLDVVDQINAGSAHIFLTTTTEGPCLESVGLFNLLDEICDRYNYPKNQITIYTANWLAHHDQYRVIKQDNMDEVKEWPSMSDLPRKKFSDGFKHFGHFINHGNIYRLQLGSYLFAHHRLQTLQTYHYKADFDYHRDFIGLEDLVFRGTDVPEIHRAIDLLSNSPIMLDAVDTYPIPTGNTGLYHHYKDFFVEIVCQTFSKGQTFYVDEKLWRPMLLKTPFMVQGSSNTIVNLRKLGFQTFDRWWDEGYSEDPEDCQVSAVIENIKRLGNLSIDQLEKIYQEMTPALEHNYELAMNITAEDFYNEFGK